MKITTVNHEDIDSLIDVMILYYKFYEANIPSRRQIQKLIETLLGDPTKGIQFVAKTNNNLVGFVTLYQIMSTLKCSEVILMNDLFVIESMRRKGIGEKLFNIAWKYTIENGFPKMEWITEPDNFDAKKFYDKMGGKSSQWAYYSKIRN